MTNSNKCINDGDTIAAPDELNTQSDFELLFLHVISHFYYEISTYSKKTQLIISIKSILKEYIPFVYPHYLSNYPESLPHIYALVDETIKINRDKQKHSDPLPDLYTYISQEMQTLR